MQKNDSAESTWILSRVIQASEEILELFWEKFSLPVTIPESGSGIEQKLDLLEERAKKEGECIVLQFVNEEREVISLCTKNKQQGGKFLPEQWQRLRELCESLESIKKTEQFCNAFIAQYALEEGRRRQKHYEMRIACQERKKREQEDRQERLKAGEVMIHGEQKIVKISQISQKTLEWLKTIMDIGVFSWEDSFVFEICDRSWVLRATSMVTADVCLDLFWHLMLLKEFFPTDDMLEALSARTGTPSMQEFATILQQSTMGAWVRMTREYIVVKRKKASELEFQAMLGDIDAKKQLAKMEQQEQK